MTRSIKILTATAYVLRTSIGLATAYRKQGRPALVATPKTMGRIAEALSAWADRNADRNAGKRIGASDPKTSRPHGQTR